MPTIPAAAEVRPDATPARLLGALAVATLAGCKLNPFKKGGIRLSCGPCSSRQAACGL